MATQYDDFFRLLQQGQPQRLDSPYGGVSLALSNAVQGFLMGRDRKQKRDASEAVATALMGGGAGGLFSGQVSGMASGMGGMPDYEGVKRSLSALGDNPYAKEMLLDLGLHDLQETAKTRNKLIELGYAGEVDKDVYRDRRAADVGYIGQEYGLKSQLSNQEYRQRVDEAERQSGLDLTKIRTQHTLDNERTLNEIEARLGADLTRSEASVWEHGAKAGIDVDKFRQQEGIETTELDRRGESQLQRALREAREKGEIDVDTYNRTQGILTEHLGVRGEAELDRMRRQYGYQTDESLREKRVSVDEDIRKKQGEVAAEAGSAATGFFTSKGFDADVARNATTIGTKLALGQEVTPEERAAYNYSIAQLSQGTTKEVDGQLVHIPGMTPDQIFQGVAMAAQGQMAGVARPAQARTMSGSAPYSRSALLNAIIRQESGGNPRARSPVGARGLMQLMPQTAVEVAREMGIRNFKVDWLDNPEINQKLGTYYIDKQLKAYNGNVPMALAAYNAGPGAVDKWRQRYGDPLKGEITVREWVNRIPYSETKGYVRNIMANLSRVAPQGAPAHPPAPMPLPQPPRVPQGGAGVPPVPQPTVIPVPQSPRARAQEEKAVAEARQAEMDAAAKEKDIETREKKQAALREASNSRISRAMAVLNDESNWAGTPLVGQVSSYIQGTPANELKYEIAALKNQFTGNNLDMLKGAMSDADLAMLGGLAGTLHIGMPREQMKKTIQDMRDILNASSADDEDLSSMSDDELKKALGL